MEQFMITIKSEIGIHARPASQLVKQAAIFSSDIKLYKGEQIADAKRLLSIMALGAKQGETVKITVEGEDEKVAVAALKEVLKTY